MGNTGTTNSEDSVELQSLIAMIMSLSEDDVDELTSLAERLMLRPRPEQYQHLHHPGSLSYR